jgi:carbamoyl-phosphate synthase large subunit
MNGGLKSPLKKNLSFLMNVLLTSVGRRNYLVDCFRDAVHPMGGEVFAVNSHEDAPALYRADGFKIAPPINSDDYISFLLEYCVEKKIELVVPLLDNDLPVLSQARDLFSSKGIFVLVPDLHLARLANDKYQTHLFLKSEGFQTKGNFLDLESFFNAKDSGEIDFPIIIKPRWGMGSLSVYEASDEEELNFYFKKAQKEVLNSFLKYESQQDPGKEILFMDKIVGDEYMLDVINDLEGNYQLTVVNKKLLRKGGETEVVQTVKHEKLELLGRRIAEHFRHPLVMDIDVIVNDTGIYIIEFNPRFSGGYPFSHAAGINLPTALIKWLKKETVDPKVFLSPKIGTKSMKGFVMIKAKSPDCQLIGQ